MAIKSASVALDYIGLLAIHSEMPDFVALEARLLSARKRVMCVLATENTCSSFGLVRALTGPMATFSTVSAPQKRVLSQEISTTLLHHLIKSDIILLF